MTEELRILIEGNICPTDPCGWYQTGWVVQNELMRAVLEEEGLTAAMSGALDHQDGPALMRLAGIPPADIACTRFWFGIRDSNHALAEAARRAFFTDLT